MIFSQPFISWIEALYKQSSARILQNAYLTKSLPILKGCRQSGSIASFLSLISAPVLNTLGNQNDQIKEIKLIEKKHKIAQYTDDTKFPLDGTEWSFAANIDTKKYLKNVSGLKVD